MPGYLRWGKGSESSVRIKQMLAKAKQFKLGEQVLAGGRKGVVIEITASGGVFVRIGNATPQQFHPDRVEKLNK